MSQEPVTRVLDENPGSSAGDETVPRDIVPSRRSVTPGDSETYSGVPGGR